MLSSKPSFGGSFIKRVGNWLKKMNKIIKTNLEINDWIKFLPEKLDLIVTDPPYPFNNQNGGKRFKFIEGIDKMYPRLNWLDMQTLFSDLKSHSNPGARVYIFANKDGLFQSKELLEKTGWIFRNILIWDKMKMGLGYHWRHRIEYIIYVTNGKTNKYVTKQSNFFQFKKPGPKDAIATIGYNPIGTSNKPRQIWEQIMMAHLQQDEIAADPFADSDPMSATILTNPILEKRLKRAYINIF